MKEVVGVLPRWVWERIVVRRVRGMERVGKGGKGRVIGIGMREGEGGGGLGYEKGEGGGDWDMRRGRGEGIGI